MKQSTFFLCSALTLTCSLFAQTQPEYLFTNQEQLAALPEPIILSNTSTGGSYAMGIAVYGTTAYATNLNGSSFAVINISDPKNLSLIGTVTGSVPRPSLFAVSGSTGYVINSNYYNTSMVVFDLSNPTQPIYKNELSLTGAFDPNSIFIQGTTAYLTDRGTGDLNFIDLSIPLNPVDLGSIDLSYSEPRSLSVLGTIGYVQYATTPGTIQVFNLAPGTATLIGSVGSGGNQAHQMAVCGTTGFVTNYASHTLGILDLSNPSQPILIGTYSGSLSHPSAIAIQGGLAYVANYTGMNVAVLDVSLPGSASFLKSLNGMPSPVRFALSGSTGYVTSANNVLGRVFSFLAPVNYLWTNDFASSTWNVSGNWQSGIVPTVVDDIYLYTNGTAITLGDAAAKNAYYDGASSFTLRNGTLTLGGSLLQSSGSQTLSGTILFASGGTVEILDGTLSITRVLSGSSSGLTLKGAGFLNVPSTGELGTLEPSLDINMPSGQLLNAGIVGSATQLVTFSNGSMTNSGKLATSATAVTISSGQILNTPTGSVAQGFAGTLTISGGSITNRGYFGVQNITSNNAVIDITGGTIVNGINTSDSSAIFGLLAGSVSISGQAQIINNMSFAVLAKNLSFTGGSIQNNSSLASQVTNISIASGEIRNNSTLAQTSATLTILGGLILNRDYISLYGGSVTISGGTIVQTSGKLAPYITNSLAVQGTANIISDASSYIGPAPLLMSGGSVSNSGLITLDKVTLSGTFTRSVANSAITGGTLTGPGNLWIAGNATITAPIQQGTVFLGWGGTLTPNYDYLGSTVNGTLFSYGTSIDASIQVTGSGAWFVLDGTIAKGTITNNGSITKDAGVSFFGLENVSVMNNNTMALRAGSVYFSGASLTNTKNFAYGAIEVLISSGLILNTPTGSVAQGFAGTLTISGGSITNRGYFGYQNSAVSNAVINITGGTIVNGTSTSDSNAYFGQGAGTVSISGQAQVVNNLEFAPLAKNLSITGGYIENNNSLGQAATNVNIDSGVIRNLSLARLSGTLTINGGSITNIRSISSEGGSVTISGGTLAQTGGALAPYITNSLAVQGTANIISDASSYIGPAPLLMSGGSVSNSGLITLDRVTLSRTFTRSVANSAITGGTLTGPGNLWIAGNATITAPIQQGTVFVGWGGIFNSVNYLYLGINTNGTLFSHGTSIDASLQVTGSGAWFVLDGTIAKGTITNNGSITKDAGVSFFGLNNVSVTNNNSMAEGVGTVYFSGASLTNTKNFASSATIVAISSGQIVNTQTGTAAQNFKGTISITGGSITNSGYFGYHDSSSNNAVITITGGTIVNGRDISDSSAWFGSRVAKITISDQAKIIDNKYFGYGVKNLSITGGSITNNNYFAWNSPNVSISGGTIVNNFRFALISASVSMTDGFIINNNAFATSTGTISISGGSITTTQNFASFITGALNLSSSFQLRADASSKIGPAPLNLSGGLLSNSGIISLDSVTITDGSHGRGLANSNISGGTLTGTGSLWIAGNATVTAAIEQGNVLVGWGGTFSGSNYYYSGSTVNGTLFSHGTSIDANIQVTGSGAWFVLDGTIAKGTITNDGLITKGSGVGFFGLGTVSVTNNSSIAESIGTVYFSGASLTNNSYFANSATAVTISSGQIMNTLTGNIAQNFRGTLTISGGSISNFKNFGYQDSILNNSVIEITGGTIINGTSLSYVTANFGNYVNLVNIKNPAQIINNNYLANNCPNVSIFGGKIENNLSLGQYVNNFTIFNGEILNRGYLASFSENLSILNGSITNNSYISRYAGSLTLSGGTIIQNYPALLAPYVTNCLAVQGSVNIINNLNAIIGPAPVLMAGGSITSHGLITLDKVLFNNNDRSYSRSVSDSMISSGRLTGTGSLWIAGNATITAAIKQGNVFVGWGRPLSGDNFYTGTTVNGTLFSHGTSIDASIQVTGSGAWFVLDGTIAKGTITNDGRITKDARVSFFGLKDISITNNNSLAESVGTVYFSGASLTNAGRFATGATVVTISSGQMINMPTGSVAQNFKGTMTISGGSITNRGFFGYQNGFSNNGAIEISGGTIINGLVVGDAASWFGKNVGVLKISDQAQVTSNWYFGANVTNFLMTGGSLVNNHYCGQSAINFVISAGEVLNNSYLAQASGTFSISGGTIINTSAIASDNQIVFLSGGVLSQNNARLAPFISQNLNIQGNISIFSDQDSKIGPAPLIMTAGSVTNEGIMTLDKMTYARGSFSRGLSSSSISSGRLTGTGSLWIAGSCSITTPITQGAILVGCGGSISGNRYDYSINPVNGTLSSSTTLTGRMQILGSGTFLASGTVVGSVTVDPFGHLSPGGLSDPVDALNISGHLVFGSNGNLDIDFDETGNDFITIYGGSLALPISPKANLNLRATGPVPTNTFFDVIKIINPTENKLSSINLTPFGGEFNIVSISPYLLAPRLFYSSTGITMVAGYNSLESAAVTGNQKAVASLLDELNGNTTVCLQEKIDELLYATTIGPITEALDTLDPAELKGQQLVIEEMSFIMNNELSYLLYNHHKSYRPFVSGGYEKLSQDSYNQYNGFSTNAGYELAGLSYGFDKWQLLGALGAEQTSTSYRKTPARSSSSSVIANLGASGFMKGWSFGLDALFGYHFIHTSRTLLPFGLKALSNHGAYNLKFEAKGAYTKVWANTRFIPYEQFGYNFTHENSFKEHGASCLDLSVRYSSRSMLRNTLGLRIETRVKRSAKHSLHIQPYVDGSWVWENRFSGLGYRASFVDTAPSMSVRGINMTRNFGKLEAGLLGSGENWSGKLNFNGMWGSRFYEMGASFTLDRRF